MYVLRTMNSFRMSFWIVPVSFARRHALLFRRDDEVRERRDHRAVHRHRHRHLVERDPVEQDLHVLDGVDRDARLADVADHARVVGVVAAVRGQIERDRQAHLAGLQVRAEEARSTPRRWRSPRTGGSSTAGSRTWWRAARAGTGTRPESCRCARAPRGPPRCRAPSRGCRRACSRSACRGSRRPDPRSRACATRRRLPWTWDRIRSRAGEYQAIRGFTCCGGSGRRRRRAPR